MRAVIEIAKELACMIKVAFNDTIYYICILLRLALPYGMFMFGIYFDGYGGSFWSYALLVVPVVVELVTFFLKAYANRIGKGSSVPVPMERFTECGTDGEVTVLNARIQEMILFVADVEDWLEKRGML